MKKISFYIITLSLLVAFIFTGCSGKNSMPYEKLELSEYVKIGKYIGVETKKTSQVLDEEISVAVKDCLFHEDAYTLGDPVTERPVRENDCLTVDIVGTIDEVTFEGGTEEDYTIITGINSFATWNDYLIGAELGQVVRVKFEIPENEDEYGEASGKEIYYNIKIKEIRPVKYPELTPDIVNEISGYNTSEEFFTFLVESITETRLSEKMDDVWKTVMSNAEFIDYPQGQVDKYKESYYELVNLKAKNSKVSLEEYLESQSQTQSDLEKGAKEYARNKVEEELVCFFIAQEQSIVVTDEEYDKELQALYEEKKHLYSSVKDVEKEHGKEKIKFGILASKVMMFVTQEAVEV
ncbi:MAG TPA: hypothetical protein VFD52_07165 [Clostridia bacterium]|nr:hypothetical protein [Clostridia bacterium]